MYSDLPAGQARRLSEREAARHVGGFLGEAPRHRNYEWVTEEHDSRGGTRYNRLKRVPEVATVLPSLPEAERKQGGGEAPESVTGRLCSYWPCLLLLLALLAGLVAASYLYLTCQPLLATHGEDNFQLLGVQYSSLEGEGGEQEQENAVEAKEASSRRPSDQFYFPARALQANTSRATRVPRTELLSEDCLWPLLALVSAVVATIVCVVVILVIIANTIK